MRSLRTVLLSSAAACAVAPAGCEWMRNGRERDPNPKPAGLTAAEMKKVQPQQLVAYLNQQANALRAVSYTEVKVSATEAGRDYPTLRDCTLFAAQPRKFRLECGTMITSHELDLGSNEQEFWMYLKRLDGPNFFFCSHEDFDRRAVNFPVPFDPDWVMMALGMTHYDPADRYTMEYDEKNSRYWLRQQTTTRQKQSITKTTVFNADYERGRFPVVRGHLIEDQNKNRVCWAEVEAVNNHPLGKDPATGREAFVQVPTRVTLEWPQQKFRMKLTLEGETVNDPDLTGNSQRAAVLFTRPDIRGSNPIDLARYQFTPAPTPRGQAPGDTKSRRRWVWQ